MKKQFQAQSLFLIGIIFSSMLLIACGSDVKCDGLNCSSDKKEESFTYELDVNGCSTGKISASSQQEKCDKLKDDSLNKNCASSMRYEMFQKECPGQSWN